MKLKSGIKEVWYKIKDRCWEQVENQVKVLASIPVVEQITNYVNDHSGVQVMDQVSAEVSRKTKGET